jgi:tRNA-dependent cyclodipeptide synthase
MQKSAILGVSIGNEGYYTRRRLRSYLEWAREQMLEGRFCEFAFLIGDSVHKYDYVVFHDVSMSDAEEKCLEIGERIERSIVRSVRATQVPAAVLHWQDIEQASRYEEILRAVEGAYQTDQHFRQEIESQVDQYLRHVEKYSKLHVDVGVLKRSGNIRSLRNYLIVEIAGLLVLAEYTDYAILVYPGEDLIIFDDIYRGEFPMIRDCLPEHPTREFVTKSF